VELNFSQRSSQLTYFDNTTVEKSEMMQNKIQA